MPDPLDVRVTRSAGVTTIALAGELDIATIPALHEEMAAVRGAAAPSVVIDAAELVFVGVSGFRALIAETSALRHGRRVVRTVNVRPSVRRVASALRCEAQLGLK